MTHLHAVMGACSPGSEGRRWIVAIYADQEQAANHATAAGRWLKEETERRAKERARWYAAEPGNRGKFPEKHPNPFDPHENGNQPYTYYTVEPMEEWVHFDQWQKQHGL